MIIPKRIPSKKLSLLNIQKGRKCSRWLEQNHEVIMMMGYLGTKKMRIDISYFYLQTKFEKHNQLYPEYNVVLQSTNSSNIYTIEKMTSHKSNRNLLEVAVL